MDDCCRSKTAAEKAFGNRLREPLLLVSDVVRDDVGAHSASVVLLFLARTAAVTDSIAAAILRGVTMIWGRTVVAEDWGGCCWASSEVWSRVCCC